MLQVDRGAVAGVYERRARSGVVGLAITAAALFTLFAGLLALVQYATPHLADNDGYYHIKMAALIREQGLRPDFIWLPLSILNPQAFYNHHLLYHVFLTLFTGDGSPAALLAGAKLGAVVMPALAFTTIWWLLRSHNIPWAAVWALGLCAISEAFLYRMSIPRAQSASLLVLALALHALLARRYSLLVPIGCAYVWLYNAFPLLFALVGAECAAVLLIERRLNWRAPLFAAAGVALGLLVNPYVPVNLVFIAQHLLPKIGRPEISVGNEWYPYDTWQLVGNSGAALVLFIGGCFAIGWRGRRFDRNTLTTFLAAIFFGLLLLKARRFVEYFPPFALIFAAFTIGPLLADQRLTWSNRRAMRPPQWMAAAVVAIGLLVMTTLSIMEARTAMARSKPAATFAAASDWLRANTPAGSLIFQTDWDDFPRLFFYNNANVYTAGLDPTYLQLYDAQLYEEWVQITRGKVDRPGAQIRDRFGAQYVVSDLNHEAFMRKAAADPLMREVHRDGYAVVYAIGDR